MILLGNRPIVGKGTAGIIHPCASRTLPGPTRYRHDFDRGPTGLKAGIHHDHLPSAPGHDANRVQQGRGISRRSRRKSQGPTFRRWGEDYVLELVSCSASDRSDAGNSIEQRPLPSRLQIYGASTAGSGIIKKLNPIRLPNCQAADHLIQASTTLSKSHLGAIGDWSAVIVKGTIRTVGATAARPSVDSPIVRPSVVVVFLKTRVGHQPCQSRSCRQDSKDRE